MNMSFNHQTPGSATSPLATTEITPAAAQAGNIDLKTAALDLGTSTGWAIIMGGSILESGTILLATDDELERQRKEGRERACDLRYGRLFEFVEALIQTGVRRLVFEDVIFLGSQAQTQLWASLRAALWMLAIKHQVAIFCVPVATLKRFATGDGTAQKQGMAEALLRAEPERYSAAPEPGFIRQGNRPVDDNEVDAIWLARYGFAVERGEQSFLGVYQRKQAKSAEQRANRASLKAERKKRLIAKAALAAAQRQTLRLAVKAAGRCCGVYRHPLPYNRAACPKCGNSIKIRVGEAPVATVAPAAPENAVSIPQTETPPGRASTDG